MKHTELVKFLEGDRDLFALIANKNNNAGSSNMAVVANTLDEVITNIKSSNDEFIEWLKLEAKNAPTWSEHSAYMKVLRYFEGIEK